MDKETESRQFIYEIKKGKAIITGFQGTSARIRLPGQIEGCPVAAVERKAFLSCKSLYAVSFPDSIEEVGDWAFAHCDNLKELSFPRRAVRFGRAVFKNCGKLERIQIREGWETRASDGSDALGEHPGAAGDLQRGLSGIPGDAAEQPFAVPELLAAAVTMLDSYYLLDLERAGSGSGWSNGIQSSCRFCIPPTRRATSASPSTGRRTISAPTWRNTPANAADKKPAWPTCASSIPKPCAQPWKALGTQSKSCGRHIPRRCRLP